MFVNKKVKQSYSPLKIVLRNKKHSTNPFLNSSTRNNICKSSKQVRSLNKKSSDKNSKTARSARKESKELSNKTNLIQKDEHETISHTNRTVFPIKRDLEGQLDEINDLTLEIIQKIMPTPPRVFKCIHRILTENSVKFKQLFPSNFVHIFSLGRILSPYDEYIASSEMKDLSAMLPETIPTSVFLNVLKSYTYSTDQEFPSDEAVKGIFKELSMRMQLHRIPRNQVCEQFLGEQFTEHSKLSKKDLIMIFSQNPFKLRTFEEAEQFARFLLFKDNKLNSNLSAFTVIKKLIKHMQDWTLFSEEQEEEIDNKVYSMINDNKASLKFLCESYDSSMSGIVLSEQFYSSFEVLRIPIEEDVKHYLNLLFFSYTYDLNKVPYLHLIKAYSQPIDDYSNEDEEKASVVRKFLEIIAKALIDKSLNVKSAFKQIDGFIYPEEFVFGLDFIGICDFSDDAVLLIVEALQYEGECEESCICLEELEELLGYYGVSS